MSLRPRPEIEKIETCPHGGPDYAELASLGLECERVLDFSVCCNPYPPAAAVRKSLRDAAINRYPDSGATEFRQALSRKWGVPMANILAGSGTTELIRLIALAYLDKGDKVLILKPTYGEYELACRLAGAEVIEQSAQERDDFWHRAEEIAGLVERLRPKGVFICNPNNPTGQYFSRADIEMVLDSLGDGLLVLDEAYVTFVDRRWSSLGLIKQANVVILRSMTKDYSLAGLRLGYAIAGEEIISTLRRVCPPWNVNAIAQKAGTEALNADGYLAECRDKLRRSQEYLVDRLRRLGMAPLPTKANFFLVKVGNGRAFRQALLRRGILVRDCASFGLPEYVRIAPRTMTECKKLVSAIKTMKDRRE